MIKRVEKVQTESNQPILIKHEYLSNQDTLTRFEKIPTRIYGDVNDACKVAANEIAAMIKIKELMGEVCVLGLVTGATQVSVFSELVRMHKEEGLSFKNVVTFNLYEYYTGKAGSMHASRFFMDEHLFKHIDIKEENIFFPDGSVPGDKVREHCEEYEMLIERYGGIDVALLGVGQSGHIAFNEAETSDKSKTRVVILDNFTIIDAEGTFKGLSERPKKVITVGTKAILASKRIIMLALGENKAKIIKEVVEGKISSKYTASYLQEHEKVKVIVETLAASELTRMKTPWFVDTCKWDDKLIRKAVVWLCQKLKKPVLKLTNKDYNDNGMNDLLTEMENAHSVNIKVFNDLQHTITGWPGGKPNTDDTYRPERANPYPKRVIIFSPHPDDDVISMGGTFLRLVEQKHDVHVAYQTSGNIAVQDDEVIRFADFLKDCSDFSGADKETSEAFYQKVSTFVTNKKTGDIDIPEARKIKGYIRKGEARAACRSFGLSEDSVHFLDLPFYETGTVKKKPLGEEDVQIIMNLIKEIKPHQIYAAGDLADPHGTHKVCLEGIFEALNRMKEEEWMKDCYIWLYRGAWMEWDVSEVDMAVPISPEELLRKRLAIFKHESQKDGVVFQGDDNREFWQRAEDRNRSTAKLYDELGMAEYEAIEAFVRYIP